MSLRQGTNNCDIPGSGRLITMMPRCGPMCAVMSRRGGQQVAVMSPKVPGKANLNGTLGFEHKLLVNCDCSYKKV